MRKIDFCRLRDVKAPHRANKEDAGIDWYIPNCYKRRDGKYTESSAQFLEDLKRKNEGRSLKYVEPETSEDSLQIWIPIGERVLIPSGIKIKIHRGLIRRFLNWAFNLGDAFIATNKSGVASKKGLVVGSNVIDYEYQGELHLSVINTGNEDIKIEAGEKIVQFIHYPIYLSSMKEISLEDYIKFDKTSRGDGGFGSSGTK